MCKDGRSGPQESPMSPGFELSEDQLAILDVADRYGREQLAPLA